jgi:hypothetical protein
VVANTGTNVLTFTNEVISINSISDGDAVVWDVFNNTFEVETTFKSAFSFIGTNASNARATTRTNLGLGATWLTNTNVTNFRTAIGLGATNDVVFKSVTASDDGELTQLTPYGIFSSSNNWHAFVSLEERSLYADGLLLFTWATNGNINYAPIGFGGVNADSFAAATRTNLGLPLPALTNTNVSNFRAAIGLDGTNASPVEYASVLFDSARSENGLEIDDGSWVVSAYSTLASAPTNTTNAVLWIEVTDGTNSYRLPLFQ